MTSSDSDPLTRPSLLARLRDPADSESWRMFADVYGPLILRYCQRRGLQPADAADVAQEVLVQVARSVRDFSYDAARGRFRNWLGVITRQKVHRLRARARGGVAHSAALDSVTAPDKDTVWDETFQAHVLEAAVERARPHFEPQTWEAFRGAWLDRRPAPEVAAALGLPVDAVYVAKSRVLKRLRDEVLLLAEDWPLDPN